MKRKYFLIVLLAISFYSSFAQMNKNKKMKKSTYQTVDQMLSSLTQDLGKIGPASWLNYFDSTGDFFMISDGTIKFKNYNEAYNFIEDTLIKNITSVNLKFDNVSFDSVNAKNIIMHSYFNEKLNTNDQKIITVTGAFEAILIRRKDGWKFRNLTWTSPH